ncbi:MAG: indole-3-glycerol-phosphate synthase [Elusimicrobia bacterium]|nr:indole-3-glycerol-phosphate synthase [Elusimicrobiota bacterium]
MSGHALKGTVLEKIAASVRGRIAREKLRVPAEALRARAARRQPALDLAAAFAGKGPGIIAEVKLRSPSDPALGLGLDPVAAALAYARNGARALSILTEPEFFGGSLEIFSAVRGKTGLPLLMKDFFVDVYQFAQARARGADAVLLIAALLGKELGGMMKEASALGLSVLVETHTEAEMEAALGAGARLIGINNRDLKTLEVDLAVTRRLAPMARGNDITLISESGIRNRTDIKELAALGCRGFLIGTAFLKTGRPGAALAEILGRRYDPG